MTEPGNGAGDRMGQAGQVDLQVLTGHATDEELAAVTAVISAMLAARQRAAQAGGTARGTAHHGRHPQGSARPGSSPCWPDRAALLHAPLTPGPGAWRRATRPR